MASRVTPSPSASVEMSHVPCRASNATAGSLARSLMPAGTLASVRPGRSPLRHVAPSSLVTANPMFVAAPSKRRPTWNVATVVRPNVKLSGSTSVWCCASALAYGSRERRRPTISQSRATVSMRSAFTTSMPAPQRAESRLPSYDRASRSFPGPASIVSRPAPPWRKSAPRPPISLSLPASPRMTSARGVPTSTSLPAVPVTTRAPAAAASTSPTRTTMATRIEGCDASCDDRFALRRLRSPLVSKVSQAIAEGDGISFIVEVERRGERPRLGGARRRLPGGRSTASMPCASRRSFRCSTWAGCSTPAEPMRTPS